MPTATTDRATASAPVEESLEALLVLTARGDQAAFRTLYDRTSGRLFAICLRIARNRALAEDFLQEAYARVWERSRQYDPQRGGAWAWMIALTRHYAIDVIRVRGREVVTPDAPEFDSPDPQAFAGVDVKLDFPVVWRALAELDEGPRRAILQAYFDGLSYQEISLALGVPVGTAKTWVSRGLAKLRRSFEGDA